MKKYLITGVAGFIGSSLAEELVKDDSNYIVGVDNFDGFYARDIKEKNLETLLSYPNFKFIELDITDAESLKKIGKPDMVIHLAAKAGVRPSINKPLDYAHHNIIGTITILEWMKKIGCDKMVFASSSSVYGNNRKIPFSETDNIDFPISPYAASKKSCELFTHTYHHLYKFNIINLRFFTVYGPRQRPDLAIHKFVKNILNEDKIELFGDGTTSRDYTYVDDIVQGVIGAINYLENNKAVYETINLGNNNPISLNEMIDYLETASHQKTERIYTDMQQGDVDKTFADIKKAKKILGYKPKTRFADGVAKFISWFKKNHYHNV